MSIAKAKGNFLAISR